MQSLCASHVYNQSRICCTKRLGQSHGVLALFLIHPVKFVMYFLLLSCGDDLGHDMLLPYMLNTACQTAAEW